MYLFDRGFSPKRPSVDDRAQHGDGTFEISSPLFTIGLASEAALHGDATPFPAKPQVFLEQFTFKYARERLSKVFQLVSL
jgi:hypothetical protein